MTTLVLVRHGETEWNRAGRIQGHSDSALTREGVLQAEAIGPRLAREVCDLLIASDLPRAHHTAAIIAQHSGHEIRLDQGLRERAFGVAEGMTYAEIDAQYPEMFSRIRETDPDFAAPQGESRRTYHLRIVDTLLRLADQHPGRRLLVVTHGGVLAAIYRWANGLPIASPHKIEIPNVAYNRAVMKGGLPAIEVWGDVDHLEAATHNDRT